MAAETVSVAGKMHQAGEIIAVDGIDYTLEIAGKPLHILRDVDLRVAAADVVGTLLAAAAVGLLT